MGTSLHSSDVYGPGHSRQAQKAHPKRPPQSTTSSVTGLRDKAVPQRNRRSRLFTCYGQARRKRKSLLQIKLASYLSGPRPDGSRQSTPSREASVLENVEELSRLRPTPSNYLIAAMGPLKEEYARPKGKIHKPDLSYVSALSMAIDKSRGSMEKEAPCGEKRKAVTTMLEGNTETRLEVRRSLQSLLACYRKLVDTVVSLDSSKSKVNGGMSAVPIADTTTPFLRVFNDENLAWLSSKGYDIRDLTIWDWILTAKPAEQAAIRLTALAQHRHSNITAGNPIPTFVLLFLLRRQDFSSRALRLLLEHAWNRLLHQHSLRGDAEGSAGSPQIRGNDVANQFSYSEMSETTIFIMIVRLLRQARIVWPAAMVSISAMMTKYITGTSIRSDSSPGVLKEQTSARLTFLYNKSLSLLAIPSSLNPFTSVVYHQRAQFCILKRMREFQPALIITREGYRGVASVQLAHKKTPHEREWAGRKALSWPPWKEEKLGIDSDIGVEHGISRAGEALLRERESGYAVRPWEDIAGISTGWDTDHSPTVQTRALMQRGTFLYQMHAPPKGRLQHHTDIWAARIRATRTVDEAWACFLAFRSLKESRPAPDVYFAMFEKVVFEAKRVKRMALKGDAKPTDHSAGATNPLPGDGLEVFPIPPPPQAIYVRTPTPTTDELLNMMIDDKIRPSGRFLAFLWHRADTFEMGLKCLRESSLGVSKTHALLGRNITLEVQKATLELMQNYLFAAFIAFLSRFAPFISKHEPGSGRNAVMPLNKVFSSSAIIELGCTHINPLVQAFKLMEIRKPYYPPPWNSLLKSLACPRRIVSTSPYDVQDVLTWKTMCHVLSQMREIGLNIDFEGFQNLCVGLEKSILASQRFIRAYKTPVVPEDSLSQEMVVDKEREKRHRTKLDAEQVLSTGILFVKPLFKRLVEIEVGSNSMTTHASEPLKGPDLMSKIARLPKLLAVPNPAQLHAFIRVLGFCKDFTGILDLVQWMGCHMPELITVSNEQMSGKRLARRCVIAIRVFLERSWLRVDHEDDEQPEWTDNQEVEDGAPSEIVQKVFDVIDESEDWGGWPTDGEVTVYCRDGRFS